ncbi:Pycsar system effector family protein [Gilvimarinus japonicus]|uniref:Pycsar system effector family protein n=1 Tax=Gilvimarinus japonicus TaxID=1796469 RepID=A0ABV7HPD4_9GAMM
MNKDEIDLLDKILSKTNDWIKFAEAKNGAIIAVVCSFMFGANRILLNLDDVPGYLILYLYVFFVFSFLSLVIALSSFIPRLRKPFWLKTEEKSDNDNPFYFFDACKYDAYSYLKLLGITLSNNKVAEKMADQIIVNSRITSLKFSLFTSSAWLFLFALLTPLGAIFIWLLRE